MSEFPPFPRSDPKRQAHYVTAADGTETFVLADRERRCTSRSYGQAAGFDPRSEAEYAVLGDVRNPRRYQHREGVTLFQAIEDAGGFTPSSASHKVNVVRGDERLRFDLRSVDSADRDRLVQPDDLIIVPSRY